MSKSVQKLQLEQISNFVYCDAKLNEMNIETKLLPNAYYDYPFLIIENFLDKKSCDLINDYIKEKNDFDEANLRVISDNHFLDQKLNKKIRNTNLYKLSETLENLYYEEFKKHQKSIEDYFKLAITSSTDIQALEYKEGFFYKAHSDDSSMIFSDDELIGFQAVARQRKITTVLFMNTYGENFEGGELKFNFLYDENQNNISLKPKMGDMLVFLSNPYFTHEVMPVLKGTRRTLVQWHNSFGD